MKKGFTLIELLVVIAIIGILSSIVLVSMGNVRANARDANRRSDMGQISLAQEMYYNENAEYAYSANAPSSIGEALTFPSDPGITSYGWINNESDHSTYCAWAVLEGEGFFTVSPSGTKELLGDNAPNDLETCSYVL